MEVAGEAEQEEEILQEIEQEAAKVQEKQEEILQQETGLKTEQVEAVKVQQEREATSGNIQEEAGEACEEDDTDEKLKS